MTTIQFELVILIAIGIAAGAFADERPNLVFMIADDCTYLDLEIYGGQAKTPNLNQLAEDGMTFSRCFQASAMCSPTRHNIFTGIYPVKSGAWPNHTCVYPGTKSIAHYLKDVGYRVALSGKTHIAPRESFPFEYSNEFRKADPDQDDPYPTIKKMIMESNTSNTPFCLFACSNEPHSPYTKGDSSTYPVESLKLPPSWVDTKQTRAAYSKYLAEVTYFDAQCGRLLKLIDDCGATSNTLVIVVSEQGSGFPFAKWTCYELGLASGMIARWPGKIEADSRSDALVEYCDIAPSFLDAAGIATPESMEGKSFLPVLLGKQLEHKTYTFGIHTTRGITNGSEFYAIRSCGTKTYRYIRNLHPDAVFTNAVTRTGGDKSPFWNSWIEKADAGDRYAQAMVTKYQHRPPEELYDVVNDPHCLDNLIDSPEHQNKKVELSAELDRWMQSQGDKGRDTEAVAHTRKAAFVRKQSRRNRQKRKVD